MCFSQAKCGSQGRFRLIYLCLYWYDAAARHRHQLHSRIAIPLQRRGLELQPQGFLLREDLPALVHGRVRRRTPAARSCGACRLSARSP